MAEHFAVGSDLFIATGTSVASPGTWASIGCVVTVTPNTVAMSFTDVRPCLNATDRKVKKKPGAVDYGNFGVKVRFDETQYETILGYLKAGTKKVVAEKLGDTGSALAGLCFVESIGVPELNEDGEVEMDISFLIDDEFDLIDTPTIATP